MRGRLSREYLRNAVAEMVTDREARALEDGASAREGAPRREEAR
jgi:hypothetical protein